MICHVRRFVIMCKVTCQSVSMVTFHFELSEGLQVKLWPKQMISIHETLITKLWLKNSLSWFHESLSVLCFEKWRGLHKMSFKILPFISRTSFPVLRIPSAKRVLKYYKGVVLKYEESKQTFYGSSWGILKRWRIMLCLCACANNKGHDILPKFFFKLY